MKARLLQTFRSLETGKMVLTLEVDSTPDLEAIRGRDRPNCAGIAVFIVLQPELEIVSHRIGGFCLDECRRHERKLADHCPIIWKLDLFPLGGSIVRREISHHPVTESEGRNSKITGHPSKIVRLYGITL